LPGSWASFDDFAAGCRYEVLELLPEFVATVFDPGGDADPAAAAVHEVT
jgi:hypothetical protein